MDEHSIREKLAQGEADWFVDNVYSNSFVKLKKLKGFSSVLHNPKNLDKRGSYIRSSVDMSQNVIHSDSYISKVGFSRLKVGSRFGYQAYF
ncbi:MAG: hypothetical protein JJU02_06680 [Cryomorphaceae bacterium]|nr:hypothetical protein [Cryomorphaceae bacterium]